MKKTKKKNPQQQRKSSNISNVNASSDDLQLAISKMLPNVVDLKPQVRKLIKLNQPNYVFAHMKIKLPQIILSCIKTK